MSLSEAIQRAEQWRKENACGEAAKVAIALLNELQASRAIPEGHVVVPGWQPIENVPLEGKFLVYLPKERCKFQVMDQNKNVTVIGNAFAFDLTPPTHWMPLPAAPANKEGA